MSRYTLTNFSLELFRGIWSGCPTMPNNLGTYSQSFSVTITGLEITPPCVVPMGDQGMKATLSTGGGQLEMRLEIPNIDEASAPQLASRAASLLLDTLVLEFAAHVEHVSEAKPSGSSFSPNSQPGSPRICIATADALRIGAGGGVSPHRPDSSRLMAIGHSVAMKLQTGEIATSADLYTAKAMFQVGIQSGDKVARFLVLYSALGLVVMFLDGTKRPTQANVDALLEGANSSLTFSTVPSGPRKGQRESLYTKLRNDFVHAEERGKDPSAARAAIEASMGEFQDDVAAVLRKL